MVLLVNAGEQGTVNNIEICNLIYCHDLPSNKHRALAVSITLWTTEPAKCWLIGWFAYKDSALRPSRGD
jgi:hypothetical protein